MTLIDKAEALEPCPFCGDMPQMTALAAPFTGVSITCKTPNCPAGNLTSGTALGDPLIAFNAWNRRAALPARGVGVPTEAQFMDAVWAALKADATDLGKQQRILAAFRSALSPTDAAQAREAALQEAADVVKRLAIKEYTENQCSKWERNAVLEAADAILALTGKPREAKSWDELSDEQIHAAISAIQRETETSRKAAILEAANVCKVFQSNARTNDAWLHACEIEEAILALIEEART